MMGLAGEIRAIFQGSYHISNTSVQAEDAAVEVKNISPRNEVDRK